MWRDECQLRLFQSLSLGARSEAFWGGLSEYDEQRCNYLLSFTRDCTLRWWFYAVRSKQVFSRTFRATTLKSITLDRCSVAFPTLTSIIEMTCLRTVVFSNCAFLFPEGFEPAYVSSAKWTSLSVFRTTSYGSMPRLVQFINLGCLEHFSTDHTNLALPLLRNRHVPRLRSFRLGGLAWRMSDLYAMLEAMPNVTKLHIQARNWEQQQPAPPRSVVPNLTTLTAYPHVAMQLVPHRPISSLQLLHLDLPRSGGWDHTCFQRMQGSTVGLREVSVPSMALGSIRPEDLHGVETLTLRPRCGWKIQTFHFPVRVYPKTSETANRPDSFL